MTDFDTYSGSISLIFPARRRLHDKPPISPAGRRLHDRPFS